MKYLQLRAVEKMDGFERSAEMKEDLEIAKFARQLLLDGIKGVEGTKMTIAQLVDIDLRSCDAPLLSKNSGLFTGYLKELSIM